MEHNLLENRKKSDLNYIEEDNRLRLKRTAKAKSWLKVKCLLVALGYDLPLGKALLNLTL